ncbi:hypothetical protein ACIQOW_16555 [Kitasatospora sp. NPDC091335]|uniref:hypothetical protein n=1 Tax=Kitasatospora sp. NPDC091335 TaxID=3364085 RepID=UPI0038208AF1
MGAQERENGRAERSGARLTALLVGLVAAGAAVGMLLGVGVFGLVTVLSLVRRVVACFLHGC